MLYDEYCSYTCLKVCVYLNFFIKYAFNQLNLYIYVYSFGTASMLCLYLHVDKLDNFTIYMVLLFRNV